MTKKWTKPVVGPVALGLAGAFTLTYGGVAQVLNPLDPQHEPETFELAVLSTASAIVVVPNTITGELIEVPRPEPVKKTES